MFINRIKKFVGFSVGYHRLFFIKSFFPSAIERHSVKKRIDHYSNFLKKGDLFFDVGANLGNRIEPTLALGAKVVAFEPQDVCSKYLKLKFSNRIHLITKGLGSKEETKDLFVSNVHLTSSLSPEWIDSVKKSKRFKNRSWERKQSIEITTLDKIITDFGVPQFIKIDVEGFELDVLRGLTQQISCISIEYTVPEQTDKTVECIKYVKQLGGSLECNYAIGETMDFSLANWVAPDEMIAIVQSEDFIRSRFGDVYIRKKQL